MQNKDIGRLRDDMQWERKQSWDTDNFFLPYNRWRYGFVPKNKKKLSDKIAVVVMNAVPVCVPGMSKKNKISCRKQIKMNRSVI